MTEHPNPDDFSADEKPRAFEAWIEVRARVRVDIDADSIDDARAKAGKLAANMDMISDPSDVELDVIDNVTVSNVWKSPTMYRVTRDGETMQVSRLMPGDVPREPNARGF